MKKHFALQVIFLSLVLVNVVAQSELNVLCFVAFKSGRNCFICADLKDYKLIRLQNLFTSGTEAVSNNFALASRVHLPFYASAIMIFILEPRS